MSAWMSWEEPIHHQVAICGVAVDGRTGQVLPGVQVRIIAMPASFSDRLKLKALQHARWEKLEERPDRTFTRADGSFRFLDLPDGEYRLAFSLRGAPHRYGPAQKSFTVARDRSGKITAAITSIALAPTGIAGQVLGASSDGGAPLPLVMAEVRVAGSGEQTWTGQDGQYYLTGVETGSRILQVTAHGYALPAGTQLTVDIKVGEIGIKDITLDPIS
jgi:hypothetical protein